MDKINRALLFARTFIKSRWLRPKSKSDLVARQTELWAQKRNWLLENSPYFRENGLPNDFAMDKDLMMTEFDRLNTVGLTKDECFSVALEAERTRDFSPTIGEVSVGLSSGTSGNRGLFLSTPREQTIWAASILAKVLPAGSLLGNKVAFFMRANNNLYEAVQSPVITMEFFDMEEQIESHLMRLNKLKPNLLVAPAGVLKRLALLQKKGLLQIWPQAVYSVAEVLEDEDAIEIAFRFRVPFIHQVYQATEGFIAHTCSHGRMHLNEDVMIVERNHIDEVRYTPIITDLVRESQPIVRYALNDILHDDPRPCPCGDPRRVIAKIEGRTDDVFYGQVGGHTRTIYPDFIRRVFLNLPDLGEWRCDQTGINEITVYCDGEDHDLELIQSGFDDLAQIMRCEPWSISFEKYHTVPGEKLRRVRQLMRKENASCEN